MQIPLAQLTVKRTLGTTFGSALVALVLSTTPGHAQTWVPLDGSAAPGTPARIEFDAANSSDQRTVYDVYIAGFWRTDVLGADGLTYARVDFPGLGQVGQIGAPELPALRPRIAFATTASTASVLFEEYPSGVKSFPMTVYPTPEPGLDEEVDPSADPGEGDPDGAPEVFVKDAQIYGGSTAWPGVYSSPAAPRELLFGAIPNAQVELFPAQYAPGPGELLVAPHLRVGFEHVGAAQSFAAMTQDRAFLCAATFPNWPTASNWFAANVDTYESRYLIVTPEAYVPDLAEFIAYRKATGFDVTVQTLEELSFVSCGNIRGAIDDWYQLGPAQMDHYCLLVGDWTDIPMCPSPNIDQVLGDDLYGSPSGTGDLDEEVFVGRLSVDDADDLVRQTQSIIDYETDPSFGHDYRRAVLVAHEEKAPDKYVGAHEAVANAAYAVPPVFEKVYGHLSGANNLAVRALVNSGVGLVAYRGHGTANTWSDWNIPGENFHKNDVIGTLPDMRPVVWSFSCTNQSIDSGDCIGETWLEEGRAVAHYGSQAVSGTSKNHVLDAAMFEAVFDLGLTTHAHAIAYAEDAMKAAFPTSAKQNEWMYFLLGDPAMKVRRNAPTTFDLLAPGEVPTCDGSGPCDFTLQVLDPGTGQPVVNALVSVFKEGFDGGDELFANAYTDAGGMVVLPQPKTLGDLKLSVRDFDGNVTLATVKAKAGAFVDLGDALAGKFGEPRLASDSSLLPGSKCSVDLLDGLPGGLGALAVSPADNPVSLLGGTVHAFPAAALVPFVLDAAGGWNLTVEPWPSQPAGSQLVLQAAILDPGGPQGFALTNALLAVTP